MNNMPDCSPYTLVQNSLKLQETLESIAATCIQCKFCQQECAFLQRYGKPKVIAENFDAADAACLKMPFECSLCRLCGTVCPVNLQPADMFLQMRRDIAKRNGALQQQHKTLLAYERRGVSRRYSHYALPRNCDTVFFPGCALAGARPEAARQLFEQLGKEIPNLGIVLDCCTKPSHDLGRKDYFQSMFGEMKHFLVQHQVRKVLVACPSCYRTFSDYGSPLQVETVYEVMAKSGLAGRQKVGGVVCVHDPCATRYESEIHHAVRQLVRSVGLSIEKMPHEEEKTVCCGEGGAVGFVAPELSRNWAGIRKREANGRRIITYCAGCVHYLGRMTPTSHLLDLLLQPQATMQGKATNARAPFTYWNRLKLKWRLKRTVDAAVTRERTYTTEKNRRISC